MHSLSGLLQRPYAVSVLGTELVDMDMGILGYHSSNTRTGGPSCPARPDDCMAPQPG